MLFKTKSKDDWNECEERKQIIELVNNSGDKTMKELIEIGEKIESLFSSYDQRNKVQNNNSIVISNKVN